MQILTTIWMVIKSSPKAGYYLLWVLYYLPAALDILKKIREVVGDDKVQIVIKAIKDLLKNTAPPAPTLDGNSTVPVNPEREKRKILHRLLNRFNLVSKMPENDVETLCAANHIQYYDTEVA